MLADYRSDAFEGSSVNAFEVMLNVWMLQCGHMLQVTATATTGKSCAPRSGMVKSNQHKAAMWNDDVSVVRNPAMRATTQ